MRIDRRLFGWGIFLVIAGGIPLLVRANVISRDLLDGWPSLWPLLLIGAGLGLVLRRTPVHVVGGAVSVLTAGVMVGGLLTSGSHGSSAFGGCDPDRGGTALPTRDGTLGDRAEMVIEFSCGTLDVRTAEGDRWALSGSGPSERQPIVQATTTRVDVRNAEDVGFSMMAAGSQWQVTVPRSSLVDLSVTINAGDGTVDLSGAKIGQFDLTVNAGSLDADLSNLVSVGGTSVTLNAGTAHLGFPGTVAAANLTLNAGSLTVCVPSGTDVRINWSGALASNNFDEIGLTEVGDDQWATTGVVGASPPATINVSANAGSFELQFGGSCRA